MDPEFLIPLITSGIAATAAVFSVILSARLHKVNELNIKLKSSLGEKKTDFYQDLLSFLGDIIDGKYDSEDENYGDLRDFIQEKFKEAAYYASPEVLKSLGDLMQHYYTNEDQDIYTLRARKLFAEMTVQIRKDLGHDTPFYRRETWLDVLRFSIKDIHEFIPAKEIKDRGRKTRPSMIQNKKKIV